ncbi:hypothetical protein EAH79_01705 [Sphingomonas koreensis]|nr:hypothetical protein EAH79_01705 [Sphingomonas koreensis]
MSQNRADETVRKLPSQLSATKSALRAAWAAGCVFNGSSHYLLPAVLRWFTANIGVHHVHHLCSTIPFYRLPAVPLLGINRLTIADSLRSVWLVLWDGDRRQLISFREADEEAHEAVKRTGIAFFKLSAAT